VSLRFLERCFYSGNPILLAVRHMAVTATRERETGLKPAPTNVREMFEKAAGKPLPGDLEKFGRKFGDGLFGSTVKLIHEADKSIEEGSTFRDVLSRQFPHAKEVYEKGHGTASQNLAKALGQIEQIENGIKQLGTYEKQIAAKRESIGKISQMKPVEDLEPSTRRRMLQEADAEISQLEAKRNAIIPRLVSKAHEEGTPEALAANLKQVKALHELVSSKRKGLEDTFKAWHTTFKEKPHEAWPALRK
jgi:hypothetical protein